MTYRKKPKTVIILKQNGPIGCYANSIGNTKKSENCFNLSSFWVGGFLGWFPKTVLPDISVQLLALDGVAVNPIQYQLIFWPYNGV